MKTKMLYIHPENDQELETIKNFCEAQNIKYEVAKSEPYNPDFVPKIAESQEQYKKGEFISVEKKEIKGFLGTEMSFRLAFTKQTQDDIAFHKNSGNKSVLNKIAILREELI